MRRPKRAPRVAVVERDRDRMNIVLFHDAAPIIRLHTNCGQTDTIGIAALLNDTIESVSIAEESKK